MPNSSDLHYQFFDDPLRLYNAMLNDIDNAKQYIYLESYKFGNDAFGEKFRDALIKKQKLGVEVKLLLDSWGTDVNQGFFEELVRLGAEVKFFKKIRFNLDAFTKSHRRNHRKLLIIDDYISYIGSANITGYSLNWRESTLRIKSDLSITLKKIFLDHLLIYNKYIYDKISYTQKVKHKDFEIICDVPTTLLQPVKKKLIELIKASRKSIVIETPYFLPGSFVRRAIVDASKRGVDVKIIIPKRSDVGLVDILRAKYFGELYKSGINILLYSPRNLHAKLMLVDNQTFALGSANFDYRSFRFQHEIMIVGKKNQVIKLLENHIEQTIEDCEPFNYEFWKRRPLIQKFFEWVLLPFRHLF